MGRKQKLREQRKKNAKNNATSVPPASHVPQTVPRPPVIGLLNGRNNVALNQIKSNNDSQFPKSEFCIEWERDDIKTGEDVKKIITSFKRGATEHGCVHSMKEIGVFFSNPRVYRTLVHLAVPWFIEGAIRPYVEISDVRSNCSS